ncbi:DUF2017 domain-containing protein [Marisediminicola senii]|uniref:DUF2017 domain-containing protein n=1 Tax=Marisediminicola senii TaxID=2711233 RepID=UPI001F1D76FA|nr:DUF2017 domain-containing protein [Marisediminicola senii]
MTPDGAISTELEPVEAALLTQLASQVAGLIGEPTSSDVPDPALLRLLPDAYPGDAEASAEFRRFTAEGLAERKVRNAQTMIVDVADAVTADAQTEVQLTVESVQSWLRTLTDIRLVLATRLGILDDADARAADGEADDDEADDDDIDSEADQKLMLADVYEWLGWVQESLVSAIDR